MERRRFGKTELSLSLVGIGGIPFMHIGPGEVEKVILKGLDCGVNFIETARGYSSSEEKIGQALKGRRKDFFLITKGHPEKRFSQLDESLRALSTDYVDVYQLHGLKPGVLEKMESRGLLERLVREGEKGKFRFLGVTSHFPEVLFQAMRRDVFTSIQAPVNFVEYDRYRASLEAARSKDLGILAMKPLGGGLFPPRESLRFLKFTPVTAVPVGVRCCGEIEEDAAAVKDESVFGEKEKARLEEELEKWGDKFCRRCGYCRGCPRGIPVSSLMLTEVLYYRNGIDFMLEKGYDRMLKSSEDCDGCALCVEKCPYSLKIPETIRGLREKYLPLLEEGKSKARG